MKDRIVIGSRGSRLALVQSRGIAAALQRVFEGLQVEIRVITTKGDKILDTPLAKIGGKGLFTKEIEAALLDSQADLAVHSLKDLPTEDTPGLVVAAIPPRENPLDALVSPKYASLAALPPGARVGTSSLRRKAQLLAANPGLVIEDLRGNVGTRLSRVHDGAYDAAILACAGLERLGSHAEIAEVIAPEIITPACGQGALAVQCREDDAELRETLGRIHDANAAAETTCERAFLAALGGGCQVPIGALARVNGGRIRMAGCVCSLDGKTILRTEIEGPSEQGVALGRKAADQVRDRGADEIIRAIPRGAA